MPLLTEADLDAHEADRLPVRSTQASKRSYAVTDFATALIAVLVLAWVVAAADVQAVNDALASIGAVWPTFTLAEVL